mmetsp:Transcript_86036/g.256672  ORF Transcript_86036/g.256672 Transcript_86036/m.256672 type:complete len:259 (-) Transcript_86036:184-960(-)
MGAGQERPDPRRWRRRRLPHGLRQGLGPARQDQGHRGEPGPGAAGPKSGHICRACRRRLEGRTGIAWRSLRLFAPTHRGQRVRRPLRRLGCGTEGCRGKDGGEEPGAGGRASLRPPQSGGQAAHQPPRAAAPARGAAAGQRDPRGRRRRLRGHGLVHRSAARSALLARSGQLRHTRRRRRLRSGREARTAGCGGLAHLGRRRRGLLRRGSRQLRSARRARHITHWQRRVLGPDRARSEGLVRLPGLVQHRVPEVRDRC